MMANPRNIYSHLTNYGAARVLAERYVMGINPKYPEDVSIEVREWDTTPSYKGFICAQSPYLARIMISLNPEGNTNKVNIRLTDLDIFAVESILNCLYSGKLTIFPQTYSQVRKVMEAARRLELGEICSICLDVLQQLTEQ